VAEQLHADVVVVAGLVTVIRIEGDGTVIMNVINSAIGLGL
jgi:hypothetical protein